MPDIPSLACARFVALGKPEKGLETPEAGLVIMANITMGHHADFLNVREADEQLHDQCIALRDRVFTTSAGKTGQIIARRRFGGRAECGSRRV